MEIETQMFTQTEHIKLEKNTKGFNWEIKVFPIKVAVTDASGAKTGEYEYKIYPSDIDRLEMLNEIMLKKFGSYKE